MSFATSEGGFYFKGVVNGLAAVLLTALLILHSIKVYQDFFTTERKCLSHRRQKPRIANTYKWVGFFTWFNLLGVAVFSYIMMYATLPTYGKQQCKYVISLFSLGYFPQMSAFCIFAVRLHMIYKRSEYQISPKKLRATTVILGIYFLCFNLGGLFFVLNGEWPIVTDTDGLHITCDAEYPGWYLAAYVLPDLGGQIVYCVLFILPIRDVLYNVQGSLRNIEQRSKLTKKMITVGFKVSILTMTIVASTIITFVFVGALNSNISPANIFFDALCLVLMTPYYPDEQYYHKLCRPCICCCDRKGYTLKSSNDDGDDEDKSRELSLTNTKTVAVSADSQGSTSTLPSSITSVDTLDAPRKAVGGIDSVHRIGASSTVDE